MMFHYPKGTVLRDRDGEVWLVGETILDMPNIKDDSEIPDCGVGEGEFEIYTKLSKYDDPSITKKVDALRDIKSGYIPVPNEGSA